MSRFDDLLDRATRKLSADPELRLEVRRELATHLAESADDHAAGGHDDPDGAAIAALGDADGLADQMYAANRRRLRVRRAVRWTVRFGSVPALASIAVAIAWAPALTLGLMMSMAAGWMVSDPVLHAGPVPSLLTGHVQQKFEAGLSPEAKLWTMRSTWPDPHLPGRMAASLAACREWAQADPRDPVARATYALHLLYSEWLDNDGKPTAPTPTLAEMLAVFSADERAEPDNALYPMLRAQVLFGDSVRFGTHFGADLNGGWKRGPWQFRIDEIHVTNPARFADGLDALHAAAARPRYAAYQGIVAAALAHAIPPTSSPAEFAIRQEMIRFASCMGPDACVAMSWAAGLAKAGDTSAAARVVPDLRALSQRMAAADDGNATLAMAGWLSAQTDGLEAVVAQRQGHRADLDRLMDRGVATVRSLDKVQGATAFWIDGQARSRMTVQMAVAGWIALLSVAALASAGPAVLARLTTGRWPAAIGIGWRAVGWGAMAALPALGYAVWMLISGSQGRPWFWDDVNYGLVAVACAVILRWGVGRSVRKRAAMLGQVVPVGFTRERTVIGLAVLAVGIVVAIGIRRPWHITVTMNDAAALMLLAYAVDTAVLPVAATVGRRSALMARCCLVMLAAVVADYALIDDWVRPTWSIYMRSGLAVVAGAVLLVYAWRVIMVAVRRTTIGPVWFTGAWAAVPAVATMAVLLVLCAGLPARVLERRLVRTQVDAVGQGIDQAALTLRQQIESVD